MSEARPQLSRVLNEAITRGPQTITRRGQPAVMIVSIPEYIRRFGRLPKSNN